MKPTKRRLMLSRTTLRELCTEDVAQARGAATLVGCSASIVAPAPPQSLARTYTFSFQFGMCQTGPHSCETSCAP